MRLYAAAAPQDTAWPSVLVSAALDDPGRYRPAGSLMVDSGAWSLWATGRQPPEVAAYAEVLRGLAASPRAPDQRFVSLDVIPGRRDRPVTAADVAAATEQSITNGDTLRAAGLRTIEVYHQGEPESHLRELVARRQPGELLGLSPRKDAPRAARRAFLDGCFRVLLRLAPPGRMVPTHGFGISETRLHRRYPWWSCDTTAHFLPARYGEVYDRFGVQVRIAPRHAMGRMDPDDRARLVGFHSRRVYEHWERLERETERAWHARGIRFAP